MKKYLEVCQSVYKDLIDKMSGFPTLCLHDKELIHSDSQDRYDEYKCKVCGKIFKEDW